MKEAYIIVGLGYGDEGKGLATDYLCAHSKKPLVIRFNGGQQAGHTVVNADGSRHVFSNFGSGVFRGAPTYWSQYCTFSPLFFLEELDLIKVRPKMYLDPLCPVTTHYDVLYNRALEISRGKHRYGSCGLGVGATVDRNKIKHLQLTVADLFLPKVFDSKLKDVKNYYQRKLKKDTGYDFSLFDHDSEDKKLREAITRLRVLIKQKVLQITTAETILKKREWSTYIFEGAQGILLDQEHGEKPHITKSNTTSKNAIGLIKNYTSLKKSDINILYVSRCYQTRHGNGPFATQRKKILLQNNSRETNRDNEFQGKFKTAPLNIERLNFSLSVDQIYSRGCRKMLLLTCLDQLNADKIPLSGARKRHIKYDEIIGLLHTDLTQVKYSFSACSENID